MSLCRFCVKTCHKYQNLYNKNGRGNFIYQIAVKYFPMILKVKQGRHLKVVCMECWNHISDFHKFRESVLISQGKLFEDINQTVVVGRPQVGVPPNISNDRGTPDVIYYDIYVMDDEILAKRAESITPHDCLPVVELSDSDGDSELADDDDCVLKQVNVEVSTEATLQLNTDTVEACTDGHLNDNHEEMDLSPLSDSESNEDSEMSAFVQKTSESESTQASLNDANISTSQEKSQPKKRLSGRKIGAELDKIIAQWRPILNCKICHKEYTLFPSLQQHFRFKHPNEESVIDCCNYKMKRRREVAKHARLHLNPNAFECKICGKFIKGRRALRCHIERTHSKKNEIITMRRKFREQSNIFSMPHVQFVSYFRLSKEAFKYVLEKITPKLDKPTRKTCVPNVLKLAATMRILAEGSYQKFAGDDYNVNMSQSSVSKSFQECIDVMYNEIFPIWISFPTDENEKCEIKEHFCNKAGFPGVIGCIAGTHIKIIAPNKEERPKYLNTNGFHSINLAMVCDHKMRFRYVSSHHQGSVHDSLVWNNSDLKQQLKESYDNGERNTWLLGDAGYPLEKYLITPFRSPKEGSPESHFNHIHAKTRNILQQAIGVLKNRFRCIIGARQLHYSPEMAGKITAVCAALHNICVHFKMEIPEMDIVPDTQEFTNSEVDDDLNALNTRSAIMESLKM